MKRSILNYPRKNKINNNSKEKIERILGKSVGERLDYINEREKIGHFEINTVILTKEKGNCLLTMTERKSRFEIIRLIPDKTIKSVNNALKEILKEY